VSPPLALGQKLLRVCGTRPDCGIFRRLKQTGAELTGVITNGKNKMPAHQGKLDDGQIKQLVAFVRDLAKKK